MVGADGRRIYRFKALSDIWTGNICGKENDLIATGLLGSLRWWFEVLVRGLGGYACDPTHKEYKNCEGQDHCVACELFGCTGWARKFRFQVLDDKGQVKIEQIKAGTSFQFVFTPLRPILPIEWGLLDATLRLIADYGAIGGKTTYKPSDEPGRTATEPGRGTAIQHRDYGLIEYDEDHSYDCPEDEVKRYLKQLQWRKPNHGSFAWASLDHFWSVKGNYLTRQSVDTSTFNRVIGRPEPKSRSKEGDSWLSGRRPDSRRQISAESKKVYSFKRPAKTFGFVQQLSEHVTMRKTLSGAWGPDGWDYLNGNDIRDRLFSAREDTK